MRLKNIFWNDQTYSLMRNRHAPDASGRRKSVSQLGWVPVVVE